MRRWCRSSTPAMPTSGSCSWRTSSRPGRMGRGPGRVFPSTPGFRCPFPVEVWARGAPGEPDRLAGVTGGQREVALPEGAWYARPAGSTLLDADVAELAGELAERHVPGLSLRGFRTFGNQQLRHLAVLELSILDLSDTAVD